MRKWLSTITLISLFLISCSQDRVNMIKIYTEMAKKLANGELASIPSFLDEKSLGYYNQITAPSKLSIEEVIDLGIEYKVPYFSMMYLASCGDHMKSANKPTDFFRYLANRDISFFSKYSSYQVNEEKSRVEKEGFVAIYRNEGGANRLSWAKFTRPDSETFKYDLLYNLKLEEKRTKEIYKEQREGKQDLDMKTFLRQLYDSYNNQNCDL